MKTISARPQPQLVFPLCVLALFLAHAAAGAELPPDPEIPDRLTLKEALNIFRTHGLDLLIAEAQTAAAAGDALVANAVPNPNAGAGWSHFFFKNQPMQGMSTARMKPTYDTHDGWFVALGDSNAIEDTLSGKRALRRSVADAALAAARLQRADAQRTLEMQVKQQYIQAVAAAAALKLARENAVATAAMFDLNQIRYRSGAISEVDLSRAEAAKLEADQAVDTAVQALETAKIQIAFLLGRRRAFSDFQVDADQLRFVVPPALAETSLQQLSDQALHTRPDLRSQENQRVHAERGVSLARRMRFPDVGLGVEYQWQGPAGDQSAVSPPTLQISVTGIIPLLYQQQGEIRRAAADARAQTVQAAKLRAKIVADVDDAYNAWLTARRLVERMKSRLLERAQRGRDLVEFQYQKGAASLLEYLDAQRTYVAIEQEHIQDLALYWNAIFQIEAATATTLME